MPLYPLGSLLLAGALLMSQAASASEKILSASSATQSAAIVELYTSEGCSSCPPADHWLSALKPLIGDSLDVVPLAFHVDYWNALGWEDPFSDARFTDRQQRLGRKNQQSTIYTPGFYVNQRETRGTRNIMREMQRSNTTDSPWSLGVSAQLENDDIVVTVTGKPNPGMPATSFELFIALYENDITREIGRGENRGRTLTHDFVVRRWLGPLETTETSSFTQTETLRFPVDAVRKNTGIAALLYAQDGSQATQAVRLDLAGLF
jgi:hypothetical protein